MYRAGAGFNPSNVAITGGTVKLGDGTAAAPAFSFASLTNTGFYTQFSGLGVAVGGVAQAFMTTGQYIFQTAQIFAWTTATPTDTVDTGLSRTSAGVVEVNNGVAGTLRDLKPRAIIGTTTNDNAATGSVGEFLTATAAAAAVSLSTGTTATVTSVTLSAGDWDVWGVIDLQFNAATSYTNLEGGISTTAATLSATLGNNFDFEAPATVPTAAFDHAWVAPMVRVSIASSTIVYLVVQATFTVNTLKAGGVINARRAR